jgi:hypothetical protein
MGGEIFRVPTVPVPFGIIFFRFAWRVSSFGRGLLLIGDEDGGVRWAWTGWGFMAIKSRCVYCLVSRFLGEIWNLCSVANMLFSKVGCKRMRLTR